MIKDEHVDIYTNTFDDAVHEELKRQRRVLSHSLGWLFQRSENALRYHSGEQPTILQRNDGDLEKLVLENVLNWDETITQKPDHLSVLRIADYIRISIHEECSSSFNERMCSYLLDNFSDDYLLGGDVA